MIHGKTFFWKKDLKSKKHLITNMTIETTILDFQLSNSFEQYESHMNAEEQQSMFKKLGVKIFYICKSLDDPQRATVNFKQEPLYLLIN